MEPGDRRNLYRCGLASSYELFAFRFPPSLASLLAAKNLADVAFNLPQVTKTDPNAEATMKRCEEIEKLCLDGLAPYRGETPQATTTSA